MEKYERPRILEAVRAYARHRHFHSVRDANSLLVLAAWEIDSHFSTREYAFESIDALHDCLSQLPWYYSDLAVRWTETQRATLNQVLCERMSPDRLCRFVDVFFAANRDSDDDALDAIVRHIAAGKKTLSKTEFWERISVDPEFVARTRFATPEHARSIAETAALRTGHILHLASSAPRTFRGQQRRHERRIQSAPDAQL